MKSIIISPRAKDSLLTQIREFLSVDKHFPLLKVFRSTSAPLCAKLADIFSSVVIQTLADRIFLAGDITKMKTF